MQKKKYIYKKKKFQIFFFIDLHHKRHNHLFILRRLNFNCIQLKLAGYLWCFLFFAFFRLYLNGHQHF